MKSKKLRIRDVKPLELRKKTQAELPVQPQAEPEKLNLLAIEGVGVAIGNEKDKKVKRTERAYTISYRKFVAVPQRRKEEGSRKKKKVEEKKKAPVEVEEGIGYGKEEEIVTQTEVEEYEEKYLLLMKEIMKEGEKPVRIQNLEMEMIAGYLNQDLLLRHEIEEDLKNMDKQNEKLKPANPASKQIAETAPAEAVKLKTAVGTRELEGGVKVHTTFGIRGEFKLFKYFYRTGEWRRVGRAEEGEYVHCSREEFVNWQRGVRGVVSQIPGIETMSNKREHSWAAMHMKKLYGDVNWFYPDTFLMPQQFLQYQTAHAQNPSQVFIAKISSSCQGAGVKIITRPHEVQISNTLKTFDDSIIQKYIMNPLLVDGLKHDLRQYILITSLEPLVAYLNEEGLARFCTEPYVSPTSSGKNDASSQLTNYAVNKNNRHFVYTEELTEANSGSKRTLTSYWKSISQLQLDPQEIKAEIEQLSRCLLRTIHPFLRHYSKLKLKTLEAYDKTRFMHIIGIDVLLDDKGKPHLLELNSRPSMAVDYDPGLVAPKNANQVSVRSVSKNPVGNRSMSTSKKPSEEKLGKLSNKLKPVDTTKISAVDFFVKTK